METDQRHTAYSKLAMTLAPPHEESTAMETSLLTVMGEETGTVPPTVMSPPALIASARLLWQVPCAEGQRGKPWCELWPAHGCRTD